MMWTRMAKRPRRLDQWAYRSSQEAGAGRESDTWTGYRDHDDEYISRSEEYKKVSQVDENR